jgi:outer membrane protein assembly factor BamA
MRRAAYSVIVAVLLFAALSGSAPAQTYSPKSIRFVSTDSSQHLDSAELLRISGLQQGVPLSKDEIGAALQKLGDSGAFADLSYTVSDAALTIKLTPAPGGQALPVRFVNFVWWNHDELLRLLEQRIPLFHGTLPLQGNQTGEVEDALVALLRDKGIPDARVTALPSSNSPGDAMDAVALSISSPEILVGQIEFGGSSPDVSEKLTTFAHALADRNFDLREVNSTVHDSVNAIFEDAGYLDATQDPPVFAPPRKEPGGYVVDVQVSIHPGPLYHIGSIAIHAQPPLSDSDLRPVLPFKTGDPAAASDARNAVSAMAHVYGDHGFLQARASANLDKNASNHTVDYGFTFSPGHQFHLASIDASALPTELQEEFSGLWHVAPGAVVDKEFQANLRDTLQKLHTRMAIFVGAKRDSADYTVIIILQLRKLPGVFGEPADPGTPIPSSAPPPQPQRQPPMAPIPQVPQGSRHPR